MFKEMFGFACPVGYRTLQYIAKKFRKIDISKFTMLPSTSQLVKCSFWKQKHLRQTSLGSSRVHLKIEDVLEK